MNKQELLNEMYQTGKTIIKNWGNGNQFNTPYGKIWKTDFTIGITHNYDSYTITWKEDGLTCNNEHMEEKILSIVQFIATEDFITKKKNSIKRMKAINAALNIS